MDTGEIHVTVCAIICTILISFRCLYRLFCRCKIHTNCHRQWHQDDVWMVLALLALAGRSVCVFLYDDIAGHNKTVGLKLLLPARLTYALCEWCMKLSICSFYLRLNNGSRYMALAPKLVYGFIVFTYVVIVLATLLECQPLRLAWEQFPKHHTPHCQKALGNLFSMAISNIVTDILLILLPIPALWSMSLSKAKKFQLIMLFSSGILVIGITVARLPLILDQKVTQVVRSMWASIEIIVCCIVSNFTFYYVLIKDLRDGHENAQSSISRSATRPSVSSNPSSPDHWDIERFNLKQYDIRSGGSTPSLWRSEFISD